MKRILSRLLVCNQNSRKNRCCNIIYHLKTITNDSYSNNMFLLLPNKIDQGPDMINTNTNLIADQ